MALAVEGSRGVAVEVNSETDFVARNADFQVNWRVGDLGHWVGVWPCRVCLWCCGVGGLSVCGSVCLWCCGVGVGVGGRGGGWMVVSA